MLFRSPKLHCKYLLHDKASINMLVYTAITFAELIVHVRKVMSLRPLIIRYLNEILKYDFYFLPTPSCHVGFIIIVNSSSTPFEIFLICEGPLPMQMITITIVMIMSIASCKHNSHLVLHCDEFRSFAYSNRKCKGGRQASRIQHNKYITILICELCLDLTRIRFLSLASA